MTTPFQRPKLVPPDGHKKVLLHSCCAPCSGEVMEALLASEIDYTIFFYNPNIHPRREYELRKNENIAFAEKTEEVPVGSAPASAAPVSGNPNNCSGTLQYKGSTYLFMEHQPCPIPDSIFQRLTPAATSH